MDAIEARKITAGAINDTDISELIRHMDHRISERAHQGFSCAGIMKASRARPRRRHSWVEMYLLRAHYTEQGFKIETKSATGSSPSYTVISWEMV